MFRQIDMTSIKHHKTFKCRFHFKVLYWNSVLKFLIVNDFFYPFTRKARQWGLWSTNQIDGKFMIILNSKAGQITFVHTYYMQAFQMILRNSEYAKCTIWSLSKFQKLNIDTFSNHKNVLYQLKMFTSGCHIITPDLNDHKKIQKSM